MSKNFDVLNKVLIDNSLDTNTKLERIKNIYQGKKCAVFSCGKNIGEHHDKFNEIKNNNDFVTACWKGAIKYFDYNCDILGIGNNINNIENYIDKVSNTNIIAFGNVIGKISSHLDIYLSTQIADFSQTHEPFIIDNKIMMFDYSNILIYNFLMFLYYLGIKEFYLFGFYLADKIINISDFKYDDIIISHSHFYNIKKTTIEPPILLEQALSKKFGLFSEKNNIKVYNVSEYGCLDSQIKRIDINSLFKDTCTIIQPKHNYRSFLDDFEKNIDVLFYCKTYLPEIYDSYILSCNLNGNNTNLPFDECLFDYLYNGISLGHKLFEGDKKDEVNINDYDVNLLKKIIISNTYETDTNKLSHRELYNIYFYHYKYILEKFINIKKFSEEIKKFDISNEYFEKYSICLRYNDYCFRRNINLDTLRDPDFYVIDMITYFAEYIVSDNGKLKINISIPDDFNPTEYKFLNDDIAKITNNEAIIHYIVFGKEEKRPYKINMPDDFSPRGYKKMNNDLAKLTDREAIKHYFLIGNKEKRNYKYDVPIDFDPYIYKEINKDLNSLSNDDATLHYINFGKNENRTYKYDIPSDFDVKLYKEINPDLSNLTDIEAKWHYTMIGKYENRIYRA